MVRARRRGASKGSVDRLQVRHTNRLSDEPFSGSQGCGLLAAPAFRLHERARAARQAKQRIVEIAICEHFETLAALGERALAQICAVGQDIESDEQRRRLAGELAHAARRRVDALQEGVERKDAPFWDDDLAVEVERLWQKALGPPRPFPGNSASDPRRTSIASSRRSRRALTSSESHPISARIAIACRPEWRPPTAPRRRRANAACGSACLVPLRRLMTVSPLRSVSSSSGPSSGCGGR